MSQKFHLDTCIFRIHGLDIKLLGTDDINFLIICLFLKELFLEVAATLLSCHKFVLILAELTLDDFFNQVNRYIHVCAGLFRTDNISFDWNRNLNFLTFLFHTQSHMNFGIRSKIPLQLSKLVSYRRTKALGNIQILAANDVTHKITPLLSCYLDYTILHIISQ